MSFWKGKNVLVTGGAGFIGSHVVEILVGEGAGVRVADNLENGAVANLGSCIDRVEFLNVDLTLLDECRRASKDMDVVLNLAAKVGGIGYNVIHQGLMFHRNNLIGNLMLEAARAEKVERFLCVSSACVYARQVKVPTPETEGFKDIPEPTNIGYGMAKRMAEFQAQCYEEEFGMKIGIVRLYNTYGPRDHFDLERAHVVPATIKRVFAGEQAITLWGDGEQTRALLYVTDAARGMVQAIEKYPKADPINIGSARETKIVDLTNAIVELSGRNPAPVVLLDTTKPSGHARRAADMRKAEELLGFHAEIPINEGLKRTVDWYRNQLKTCHP